MNRAVNTGLYRLYALIQMRIRPINIEPFRFVLYDMYPLYINDLPVQSAMSAFCTYCTGVLIYNALMVQSAIHPLCTVPTLDQQSIAILIMHQYSAHTTLC